jgi:hypothetical protein
LNDEKRNRNSERMKERCTVRKRSRRHNKERDKRMEKKKVDENWKTQQGTRTRRKEK